MDAAVLDLIQVVFELGGWTLVDGQRKPSSTAFLSVIHGDGCEGFALPSPNDQRRFWLVPVTVGSIDAGW